MYVFEFLLYHMKLYGSDHLPRKISFDEVKQNLAITNETAVT